MIGIQKYQKEKQLKPEKMAKAANYRSAIRGTPAHDPREQKLTELIAWEKLGISGSARLDSAHWRLYYLLSACLPSPPCSPAVLSGVFCYIEPEQPMT